MKSYVCLLVCLLLVSSIRGWAQETPEVEVFTGYSVLNAIPSYFLGSGKAGHGWGVAANYNFNRWIGMELGLNGAYSGGRPYIYPFTSYDVSSSAHTISLGPRFTYRSGKAITPFAHALAGVSLNRSTTKSTSFSTEPGAAPLFGKYTDRTSPFTATFGGGFDVKMTNRIHWRAVQADYVLMRNGGYTRNFFRFSLGPVIRIGKTD